MLFISEPSLQVLQDMYNHSGVDSPAMSMCLLYSKYLMKLTILEKLDTALLVKGTLKVSDAHEHTIVTLNVLIVTIRGI